MDKNEVCDFKDCNDEATDVIDCEYASTSFSVHMCLQHYMYFVSDQSLEKVIDLKPTETYQWHLLHSSDGFYSNLTRFLTPFGK